jgi:hypothetical protein
MRRNTTRLEHARSPSLLLPRKPDITAAHNHGRSIGTLQAAVDRKTINRIENGMYSPHLDNRMLHIAIKHADSSVSKTP